eukprot:4034968-Pleurochrysis_carterae.AAC.2
MLGLGPRLLPLQKHVLTTPSVAWAPAANRQWSSIQCLWKKEKHEWRLRGAMAAGEFRLCCLVRWLRQRQLQILRAYLANAATLQARIDHAKLPFVADMPADLPAGSLQRLVRVFSKTNLTDKATDAYTEFKPHLPPARDGAQMQTNPMGVRFMLGSPSLGQDPGDKACWKREEGEDGWNRAKIEEWNELFSPFTLSTTQPDSVPKLPATILESPGEAEKPDFTLVGIPGAWQELWGKLAGRFPRPHLAAAQSAAPSSPTLQHSSGAADISRNIYTAEPSAEPLPLPLHNSVTGLNYLPGA